MKVFYLLKLFIRFIKNVFKFMMKMMLIFTILALIFGIQVSMVMMLILMLVMSLLFVNKRFSISSESHLAPEIHKEIEPYDFLKDDYWTPGQLAITTKSFIHGFVDM